MGLAHLPTENSHYAVSTNVEGAILLVPLATIPQRELLVFETEELTASLCRGLADAAQGNVRALEWVIAADADDE